MNDSVGLSRKQMQQVSQMAELEVRRYFDHYLTNVFPKQVEAVVKAHDDANDAHGGRIKNLDKMRWVLTGAVGLLGLVGGVSIDKIASLFGG